jgi:hypothetical protein
MRHEGVNDEVLNRSAKFIQSLAVFGSFNSIFCERNQIIHAGLLSTS